MASFLPLPKNYNFALEEEKILKLWDSLNAFERSVEQRKAQNKSPYTFYDGPPFATGLPHYGHIVASAIKDTVARYWTMRGHYVERRFGWDTHGLPIEMETEKALGLLGPSSIRDYGIDKFNEACRAGVLRHTADWRRVIGRIGRWVDFDNDYKTMDRSFMESVWWTFAELWKKGLVFQGFRVMPYSVRLSTPLSNFEANLNYQEVQDPSVTIKAKVIGQENTFLLIWTSTPWTLPANLAIAVNKSTSYVKFKHAEDNNIYIVAKDLCEALFKSKGEISQELGGHELLGLSYEPIYPGADLRSLPESGLAKAFHVIHSDHVNTESGTGLVHMAPAFGVDDFEACKREGIPLFDPIDEEGKFTSLVPALLNIYFKDADKIVLKTLKEQDLLFERSTFVHSYPFCWRSNTPLMYKAVPVWFIDVPKIRDRMYDHNQSIHWVPEAVGQKRFANWLKDAQEWSVSRNRFWGTPIPIWICDACGEKLCVSSVGELEKLAAKNIADIHSHFIDNISFACASCSGTMKRVPEVFDCWFESGSMPMAQVHYPFENKEAFKASFPADFIAEGLDQTRGWFYTLLVISSALFDSPPFKNVVVNGMVLASDGSKMSKSKKNYPDPEEVVHRYGADAVRAYLLDSPVVRAEPLQFNEQGIKDVVRSFLLPLYNSWSFFVQYANIDAFDPKIDLQRAPAVKDRAEIDRWILSKMQSMLTTVNSEMNSYYLYKTIGPLMAFIDDLTNWYIRSSRRRFWKNAEDNLEAQDKLAAYATLYEVLVKFSQAIAPLFPFVSESIYQNLVVGPGMHAEKEESVHLSDYPEAQKNLIDLDLENAVAVLRQVVFMGRALREKHRIKTRQPLRKMTVLSHVESERDALLKHAELICTELNVRELYVAEHDEELSKIKAKANYKTLGPRLGKDMGQAAKTIEALSSTDCEELLRSGVLSREGFDFTAADIVITREARADVVVMSEKSLTVALDAELDEDLIDEGIMRECLSNLQRLRKSAGLDVTDRIVLHLYSESKDIMRALERFGDHMAAELLADEISLLEEPLESEHAVLDIDDAKLMVELKRAI
jgi:isoleucyl-tRNA synthetase